MERPVPVPSDLDAPFWEATKAGRLLLQRTAAGAQSYPRGHSLASPADSAPEWVEASGRGTVETFSVVHRSFYEAIPAPYVFAVVRLAEGPLVTAHIVDVTPDAVRIGMAVEVAFVPVGDVALPVFRPAA